MLELDKNISSLIQEKILEILKTKEKMILGVVGGNSIKGVLNELVNKEIPWEKVHFYMIDERFVNISDENSNYWQLKEKLLDKIVIKKENLHPFDYSLENPVEKYEKEFLKNANNFDLILLSAGEDGHIASLFPNHDSITDNSGHFIKVEDSPKPPSERINVSRKLLENSKIAILLFSKGKEQAYEMFLDHSLSVEQCPAKLINLVKEKHVFTYF